MAKVDWYKIRIEYETTGISQRKLAKKYKVSPGTLLKRANREGWAGARLETKEVIEKKVTKLVTDKMSDKIAESRAKQTEVIEALWEIALEMVTNREQFNKHIVKLRTGHGDGISCEELTTKKLDVANTKLLKDIASSVAIIQGMQDKANGYISPAVQQKLDLDRERLAIDKTKAGLDDENEENPTGIAEIPSVNMLEYEAEREAELKRLKEEKQNNE